MARVRYIKPGFMTNDLLAECEPLARILFIDLTMIADREGRLDDRPKKIKAECLPYDDVDCDSLLSALAEKGFIIRYMVGSARYIQIVNFLKHQSPHKKEMASQIPPPPGYGPSREIPEDVHEEEQSGPEITGKAEESPERPGNPREEPRSNRNMNSNRNSERVRARDPSGPSREIPDGLVDSPVMVSYWRQFRPDEIPAIGTQERAIANVKDLSLWQETLDYWRDNKYRPESLGKMIDTYLERVKAKPNGDLGVYR